MTDVGKGQRERRSTAFFDEEPDESTKTALFDLKKGPSDAFSTFPYYPTRSNAAWESALEPLHRALFGRAGKSGERYSALGDFCGVPKAHEAAFKAKLESWKKEALKALATQLRVDLKKKSASSLSELREELIEYLMNPKAAPEEKEKTKSTSAAPQKKKNEEDVAESTPRNTKKKAASADDEAPPKKKARSESTKGQELSDDALKVAVYKNILILPSAELKSLSVKLFRESLEKKLKLPEGALKARKNIVSEVAHECLVALRAASPQDFVSPAGSPKPSAAAPTEKPEGDNIESLPPKTSPKASKPDKKAKPSTKKEKKGSPKKSRTPTPKKAQTPKKAETPKNVDTPKNTASPKKGETPKSQKGSPQKDSSKKPSKGATKTSSSPKQAD